MPVYCWTVSQLAKVPVAHHSIGHTVRKFIRHKLSVGHVATKAIWKTTTVCVYVGLPLAVVIPPVVHGWERWNNPSYIQPIQYFLPSPGAGGYIQEIVQPSVNNVSYNNVPEPSSLLTLLVGMFMMSFIRKLRCRHG